eukprot:485387-Rhodomonas_salina.3
MCVCVKGSSGKRIAALLVLRSEGSFFLLRPARAQASKTRVGSTFSRAFRAGIRACSCVLPGGGTCTPVGTPPDTLHADTSGSSSSSSTAASASEFVFARRKEEDMRRGVMPPPLRPVEARVVLGFTATSSWQPQSVWAQRRVEEHDEWRGTTSLPLPFSVRGVSVTMPSGVHTGMDF